MINIIMKSLNINTFIKKSKEIHGDKYDYSQATYVGCMNPLTIICPIHGPFTQTPNVHINRKCGCKMCANERKQNQDYEQFVKQATQVHNKKYNYPQQQLINTSKDKITIICPTHGPFQQLPVNHLMGNGCPACSGNVTRTTEDFISSAIKIHGDFYGYELVDYKTRAHRVSIRCPRHGMFEQRAGSHLRGNGCPLCKQSHGERIIRLWLDYHNVNYLSQYRPENLKSQKGYPLSFDFFIPQANMCIEYDGEQHYRPVIFGKNGKTGKSNFTVQQVNDEIKTQYCKQHNIQLIRIPHTAKDDINTLLSEAFF